MRIGTGKQINKAAVKARKVNKKVQQAIERADKMRKNPSWLEKIMIQFLDDRNVKYQFQRIFYIRNDNNAILYYYIADFYIPDRNLIVEVDGKFHDDQIEKDDKRTEDIKKHYPGVELIRVCYDDFKSLKNLDLISKYVMNDTAYRKMFSKKKEKGKR